MKYEPVSGEQFAVRPDPHPTRVQALLCVGICLGWMALVFGIVYWIFS